MPLLGCLDLLLADIDQASARFSSSSDEKLRDWLNSYPGNQLEAICIFCKNWLENDVLVGYRDIDSKVVDLNSWFEDREIQEFIEKLEMKSNKILHKSNLSATQTKKDFSKRINEDFDMKYQNIDERGLPWPGGIKEQEENTSTQENQFEEKVLKNKPIEFYRYLVEKIAELKFSFGEFLEKKAIFYRPQYLTYFYAFVILFSLGIGFGLLKNNSKKTLTENNSDIEKPLVISNDNLDVTKKNISKDIEKESNNVTKEIFEKKSENVSFEAKELTVASPSIEEIKYLIETWLVNKSNYLAGKDELNISKIAKTGLIKRTIKERQIDIEKGRFKEIDSQIQEIVLKSQNSSRIVAMVEMNYLERTLKNSGELINETSLTPLKVKYILGFSNKSWKLADFVSGL